MNIFVLDTDITKCAHAHIDLHVGKMILEIAQLLSTAIWVDKYLGTAPRALNKEELDVIKTEARPAKLIPIDERTEAGFIRYLPTHVNHPCSIWVRSSYDNYRWALSLVEALNEEAQWRGFKAHASCAEALALPDPQNIPRIGLTPFAQAMPDEYMSLDAVDSYRHYYMGEKANIAVWRRRGKPDWWDENLAMYDVTDPHDDYLKTVNAKVKALVERILMGHYDDEREYDYTEQQRQKKEVLEIALEAFQEFRSYKFPGKGWTLSHIKDGERLYFQIERNIKAELYDLRRL